MSKPIALYLGSSTALNVLECSCCFRKGHRIFCSAGQRCTKCDSDSTFVRQGWIERDIYIYIYL